MSTSSPRTSKAWHLWQLLLLLAMIALLPALLAGGLAVRSMVGQHRSEVERLALDLSRALATAVGTELNATIVSLRTLSQAQEFASGDIAAFYSSAQKVAQGNPSWRAIVLADAQGRVVFNTSFPLDSHIERPVEAESLLEVLRSGRPVVGRVARGLRGNTAFPVRVPVTLNGTVRYVLTAVVVPERITDILTRQNVPDNWISAVFDSAGRRVARTMPHENTAPSPSLARLLSKGAREGVGITTTLEGVESVTAFVRLQGHDWTIAVGLPTDRVDAGMWRGAYLYLAGMLASVAAWAFATTWVARYISRSVSDLRERATEVVRKGKSLAPQQSRIQEIDEADEALVALSIERATLDAERERLLTSLNVALDASRLALSQAEEAGRAKDHFLAMLGHEMRNPLAPIVSALDLLDLRGDERTATERAILRRQVNQLHRLVDDLLNASRIVQGKLEFRKEPLDLRQVAHWAEDAVKSAADSAGTRLELDLGSEPMWVEGDFARLAQAVSNLLSNALRFARGGTVRLSMQRDEDHAILVVEDNGAGMDAETLQRVFQPFFQAPQSLERSHGGLGLGLAVVKAVVDLHHGSVVAHSGGAGKGARFELRLPLALPPSASASAPLPASPQASRRVLVVDDNVDAAELTAAGLQAIGHEVCTAHSAREALALIRTFRPDVAVLDIGMPDMDGYQLARAIRSPDLHWSGKLIALTGYGQPRDKEQARDAGFDHHFTKPVQFADLNRAVSLAEG